MAKQAGLIVDMRPGEGLTLSGPAHITLLHKSGQFARLRVVATPDVRITREPHEKATDHVPSMATCIPS